MPDIYFKSVPFSKEDVTLALESGVDGIITEAEHVEGVRSLALCDVRAEADMPSVGLGSKAEEESIASRIAGGERLVLAQGWEIIPVENLLAQPAARRAVSEPGSAAIGHKSLSTMLGLPILAYNLEDEPTNQTRFVVIGPKPTDTSAANKTSVLFTLPDKPGSLAGILDLLFKAGVNLRKLESRPLRSQSWKYAFFADLETNLLLSLIHI